MKQDDKELLLRDLCGRLPYGVKIALNNSEAYHHDNVAKKGDVTIDRLKGFNGSYFSIFHDNPLDWDWYVSDVDIKDIKPYLFPLSSMTKEQKREYHQSTSKDIDMLQDVILERINGKDNTNSHAIAYNGIDWLNAHHFDYRGLIEKGLAIDAIGLNIYKEETK